MYRIVFELIAKRKPIKNHYIYDLSVFEIAGDSRLQEYKTRMKYLND